ncbi:MAG: cytochrome c oxidase accessory protein CcoG [Sphingomonadales bacterium]
MYTASEVVSSRVTLRRASVACAALSGRTPMLNPQQLKPEPAPDAGFDGPLYASRVKVYPKKVRGAFRRFKWAIMVVLLGIYYVAPWLRWDRGALAPDQAILLDLPARRFYFFFLEFWSQEIYYMAALMVLSAVGLFLVTSVFGRAWCGYACPQTVWSDLFFHVERWIEGDRNTRIRKDKMPLSVRKVAEKTSKHVIWILISIATGGAWIFYFADAPTLFPALFNGTAPAQAYGFIALFTGSTYLLGGIAKEQVCIYMCPWPRIQGAMLDDESLIVSYREDRGEPRGPIRKHPVPGEETGDCINCNACVYACPMGIDIRNGPQLECIQCALCIDACDEIMDKVERPRGLIAYDSFANQERRAAGKPEQFNFIRTRTVVYALVIALIGGLTTYFMLNRSDADLNVLADRNPAFVTLADGSIRNGYTVRLMNKANAERVLTAKIEGLGPVATRWTRGADSEVITIGPDSLVTAKLFVSLKKEDLEDVLDDGVAAGHMIILDQMGYVVASETMRFQGPRQ